MKIRTAEYIGSFTKLSKCPQKGLPEFAFIGRSNVGKSSLINMLCERKDLAKTSNTPGKTQLLNYFLINVLWYLVDLPGYGYAKISKKSRAKWEIMIHNYLSRCENLMCAFVLLDSRHTLQQNDLEFLNWLGENSVPFVICYTKADKIGPQKRDENITAIEKSLLEYWEELPQRFVSSSKSRVGRDDILLFIQEVIDSVKVS